MWIFVEFFPEILVLFHRFKDKFTSRESMLVYPILFTFLIYFYVNNFSLIYYLISILIFVLLVFWINRDNYLELIQPLKYIKVDNGLESLYFEEKIKISDLRGKIICINLPRSHLPVEIIFSESPVQLKFNNKPIESDFLGPETIILKRIIYRQNIFSNGNLFHIQIKLKGLLNSVVALNIFKVI